MVVSLVTFDVLMLKRVLVVATMASPTGAGEVLPEFGEGVVMMTVVNVFNEKEEFRVSKALIRYKI